MSLVKSYFYLIKMRCRAVPASLSQGLGFAETPDSFEVRGPPSPSSVLSRKELTETTDAIALMLHNLGRRT
jgi:hypothetical protein